MKEINFNLSIEETNTILSALGNMPYNRVFQLILKIQGQATKQIEDNAKILEADKSKQ